MNVNSLQFLTAKSTRVDFDIDEAELQLQIEASAPGVYRIRCAPAAVLNNDKPSARAKARTEMLLVRTEPVGELAVSSVAEHAGQAWYIEQGDVTLEVHHSPFRFALHKGNDCLFSTYGDTALSFDNSDDQPAWQLQLQLDPDEGLFGLGETAGDFDRRGQVIDTDASGSRALPLMWSPRGWGLYINTLDQVVHDLGSSAADVYTIQTGTAVFDVFIFAGEPCEILNQYTALTGRAGQPELWPMGVWLDQAVDQTIDELHRVATSLRESEYAFDVVRLAEPAIYGFQPDKPAFEWDPKRVAEPRDMLARFHELDARVAAPTFPGVLVDTYMFEEWEDRGWLLLDDDSGEAYRLPGNDASGGEPFGLLDLTHKDVYKLFSERQRQIIDDGLGAPVCNAQFDIPDGVTARGGETGALLRTMYPILVRQALFDAVAGHKTPQEGVLLSTDLFPGVQRYAWQKGPIVTNDWDGFEHSLRTALALGNSAIPVQAHTLGSARSPCSNMNPELYIRWLAANVFSANFSFQAIPQLLPDAFDEPTRELVKHWLEWRYRLIPYVLGIIEDSVRTGMPVQRSMALSFPDDTDAHAWDTQYLFGPALLIAPVFEPGTEHEVYLPAGSGWWDLSTGWRYEGGTVLTVQAELNALPVFGREGEILCLGPAAQHTGEFNSARMLEEVWMFGMPENSPVVMRNKIRVMQMQGSSYIKGLEGLRILPSEGLEVKRRGAEVRISRMR